MKKALIILSALALIWSCSDKETTGDNNNDNNNTSLCDSLSPNYTDHIKPVMDNLCTPCHISSSDAGVNVSTYNNTKSAAGQSVFVKSLKHEAGAEPMPKNAAKLSDNTIELIECWIENGFPEN
ncbi:MAG: hypothetical protein JXR19_04095 [Bacteroidia bacterium]